MKLLDITIYPNPVLAKKAKAVKKPTLEEKELISKMVFSMKENDGVGLAAPQVNISKKIIVMQDGEEIKTYINPRIISRSKEKHVDEEGCLSLPGIFIDVPRSASVEIEAENQEGKTIRIKAEGLTARIFQRFQNGIL